MRNIAPFKVISRSQSGFGVLALFIVVLVSTLAVGIGRLLSFSLASMNQQEQFVSTSVLAINLQRALRVNQTYYMSITLPSVQGMTMTPDNSMLLKCMTDDSALTTEPPGLAPALPIASIPNDCVANLSYDVTLYGMAALSDGSISNQPVPIVGTKQNPVLYDRYGRVCAIASSACVMQVSGSFTPDCGGPAACNIAKTLSVSATISPVPGSKVSFPPFQVPTSAQIVPVYDPADSDIGTMSTLSIAGQPPTTVVPGQLPPPPPPVTPPQASSGLGSGNGNSGFQFTAPPPPPPPPPPGLGIHSCPPGQAARMGGCRGIFL